MKTQVFITIWIATIAVALFFGLSNVTITQKQHQRQYQSQITRQDNLQLVFMDTRMKLTNVYWEHKGTFNTQELSDFINGHLNFFQQMNLKTQSYKDGTAMIWYPVFNKESKTYTNENTSFNSNYNEVKLNPFGKIIK